MKSYSINIIRRLYGILTIISIIMISITRFRGLDRWIKNITKKDINHIKEVLGKYKCKKIIIAPDKEKIESNLKDIDVWDVKDILRKIEEKTRYASSTK